MNLTVAGRQNLPLADLSTWFASGRSIDTVMREIWLRTLGPKARGSETHILRLGVGLRRVVRLLKEIEAEFGVKVPPTALMRLGTAEALVTALQSQVWPKPSPCVMMKDGDGRPPLYIVSAGSGLVLELCDLALAMDYPGQVWGLQLPGLDGEATPLTNLVEMGQFYADAIRERQASGPYHLIGYSFGGGVALEAARNLAAAGGEIGLLGLIDSNVDERYWPKNAWLLGILKRSVVRALDARHLPPKQAVEHIMSRARRLGKYFGQKTTREVASPGGIQNSSHYIGGFEPDFQKVRDAAIIAFESYNPRKTDLRITLFKSELGDPHACDPVSIWRRVTRARNLEIVMVPGSHATMVRPPHAQVLAAAIVAQLSTG